jgi:hypothetical protein
MLMMFIVQVASMVVVSWFKEFRLLPGKANIPEAVAAAQPIMGRLLELLACGDAGSPTPGSNLPYAELLRMFAKMRTEASALIKHAETMGSFKASFLAGLPATTAMSAEAAVELATKLVQPPNDAHDGETDGKSNAIYDAMESARQQLLATAGYLLVVQVCNNIVVSYGFVLSIVFLYAKFFSFHSCVLHLSLS